MFRLLLMTCFVLLACNNNEPTVQEEKTAKAIPHFIPTDSIDTERWKTHSYRDKNWNPKQGKYYFSETWTWSYKNDFIPIGELGHEGKMSIDIDPVSGMMLFTKNDSQLSDEMIDYIIASPEGQYITCWTDVHGEKQIDIEENQQMIELNKDQESVVQHFKKYVKALDTHKLFGQNDYQWPTTKAYAYEMTYKKTIDKNQLFLAEMPISLLPLYLFNKRNNELRIPISLEFGTTIPKNILVVEDRYELENKVSLIQLVSMSPSDIHIDIKPYLNKEQ